MQHGGVWYGPGGSVLGDCEEEASGGQEGAGGQAADKQEAAGDQVAANTRNLDSRRPAEQVVLLAVLKKWTDCGRQRLD